ncbi:3'-5' exonuclease [Timonella senegalensis]|uniref:3'-5' exonuclease n=1 Tax=Timonella senegalensis TaxID=1465825 RepID=UPI0018A810BE|nr:3'-5' exonuclease [Timonella senegalensis]
MAGFAVVDVETTGFNARGADRIVELAVVHADEFGRVTGQWTTMVNPHRDLGESGLHGLREAEIVGAPGFSEIAESLSGLLRGRVLVAHNARFAERFLEAEFKRAGREMPQGKTACTAEMSKPYLRGPKRSLKASCKALGVPLDESREVLGDAVATALLLSALISRGAAGEWVAMQGETRSVGSVPVPDTSAWRARGDSEWRLSGVGTKAQIVENQRDYEWLKEHAEYLAVLENALMDRLLSPSETRELTETAESLGLGQDEVELLHREFFRLVVRVALRDGVLSKEEKADLAKVGELLGISVGEQKAIVKDEKASGWVQMDSGLSVTDVGDVFSGIGAAIRGAGRALREAIFDFNLDI